jgi:predicted nucleic acid-binding Zn ribbon protein
MLTSINEHLKKSINKAGLNKQVEATQICELWRDTIKEIFTQETAERSQAIKFKKGILTVAVLNSVLAQEFKFKEEEIKAGLNKKVDHNVVKKIRFEM